MKKIDIYEELKSKDYPGHFAGAFKAHCLTVARCGRFSLAFKRKEDIARIGRSVALHDHAVMDAV